MKIEEAKKMMEYVKEMAATMKTFAVNKKLMKNMPEYTENIICIINRIPAFMTDEKLENISAVHEKMFVNGVEAVETLHDMLAEQKTRITAPEFNPGEMVVLPEMGKLINNILIFERLALQVKKEVIFITAVEKRAVIWVDVNIGTEPIEIEIKNEKKERR